MIIYKYPMIELEETRIIKSVEELTVDEIKEQMALFQRLYYLKTKDTPEAIAKRKEKSKIGCARRKAKKEQQLGLETSSMDEPFDRRKYKKDIKDAMVMIPQ